MKRRQENRPGGHGILLYVHTPMGTENPFLSDIISPPSKIGRLVKFHNMFLLMEGNKNLMPQWKNTKTQSLLKLRFCDEKRGCRRVFKVYFE